MKKTLISLGAFAAVVAPVVAVISCGSSSSKQDDDKPKEPHLDASEDDFSNEVSFADLKTNIKNQLTSLKLAVDQTGNYFTFFQPKEDSYSNSQYHQKYGMMNKADTSVQANIDAINEICKIVNDALGALTKWTLDAPLPVDNHADYKVKTPILQASPNADGKLEVAMVSGILDASNKEVTLDDVKKMTPISGSEANLDGVNIAVQWDANERKAFSQAIDNALTKLQ